MCYIVKYAKVASTQHFTHTHIFNIYALGDVLHCEVC